MKKFAEKSVINVDRSSSEVIRRWIDNVKQMKKRVEELPKNDMRRYFELG